ncbi:MAG: nucleotidyltransferase domain-containing protein [Candidatus Eisenbacteria bacterium]
MNHGRYAAGEDDHALLAALVEAALEQTRFRLEEVAGPLEAVILGGSLARGEGTVWRGAHGPVALSDIDLAVVVRDEPARERAAQVARALRAGVNRRLAERGLLGGFDLGLYTRAGLARQAPRPGTLEYRRSGRVLAGAADATAGFPALEEKDVPAEEALVLLENRGAELLLAWPGGAGPDDPGSALRAMYAGLKAQLDGAFAFVVAQGECPASTQARQAALERWTTVEGRSETLRAVLPDSSADAAFWGAMKLAPDPAAIALRLQVPDAADLSALGRRAWRDGARAWVGYYRAVAARVFGLAGAPSLEQAAAHAAHRARPRRRLRRWWETARAVRALEREGRAAWALRSGPARLRLALGGTPEHELASVVAVLLGGWALAGTPGAADWRPAMEQRFPGECPDHLDWDRCRQAAVRLWDTLESGGARTAWEISDPLPGARAHVEEA